MLSSKTEKTATRNERLLAASMYGAASLAIMFVNKHLLQKYHFPSVHFIALLQTFGSLSVLSFQRWVTGSIYFPPLSMKVFWEIQPLPLLFFCNMLSGLGATKSLSMPMFVLLRRFSIPMTMLLEKKVLGKDHKSGISVTIMVMILGALVAASGDMTIDLWGCCLILLNDIFTAANGVMLRWKQDKDKANLDQLQAASASPSGPESLVRRTTSSLGSSLGPAFLKSHRRIGSVDQRASSTSDLAGVMDSALPAISPSQQQTADHTEIRVHADEVSSLCSINPPIPPPTVVVTAPPPTGVSPTNTNNNAGVNASGVGGAPHGVVQVELIGMGATTELGNHGLLFYNSMFTFPIVFVWLISSSKEVHGLVSYDMWRHPPVVLLMIMTGFMGFFLQYSTYLCTKLNSPLTTTVVGCLKNFFTTFLGMLYSDYIFTILSFSGATISFIGSLWYSWIEFSQRQIKEDKNRFV